MADFVSEGKRSDKFDLIENMDMKRLIKQCWDQSPKDRLKIEDVVAFLETIMIKINQPQPINFI